MKEGASREIARERDLALRDLQVLAAEIRAHEQAMRLGIRLRSRPAAERPSARAPHGFGRDWSSSSPGNQV